MEFAAAAQFADSPLNRKRTRDMEYIVCGDLGNDEYYGLFVDETEARVFARKVANYIGFALFGVLENGILNRQTTERFYR